MSSDSGLRNRGEKVKISTSAEKKSKARNGSSKNGGVGVMDVLRILGGLFLLNCLLSYFITNDSVLWGWRPWFVRPGQVMRYFVSLELVRSWEAAWD
jgi:isoprenylcysteine carboxyl methyltransferase (ICMT) family protein YpbQ